jgi:uncharacterized membrane protein YkvI
MMLQRLVSRGGDVIKEQGVSSLKVAATYIGTIVGAGFATGQEVLQFFARFGAGGLAGLVLSAALFILYGYIIMDLGYRLKARSHSEIIRYASGKYLGGFIDFIITFFLFGGLTAMIAGTGALFQEQFALPGMLGNLSMAVLTALTVLTGINGVINSISFVVPFLIAAVVGISLTAIVRAPPVFTAPPAAGESGLIGNWLLAAILYASYNTLLAIAVLGPLGDKAASRRAIRQGASLGGMGLGLGAIMIYLALLGDATGATVLEVPMIAIAGSISGLVRVIYAVILSAEVYTTAVSSLFGFAARVADPEKFPLRGRIIIVGSTAGAFFASQLGFSNLVKFLYPAVGYGGIILLIALVYTYFRPQRVV